GQLHVHDTTAAVMQVQSFGCCIGGQKDVGGAMRELIERHSPLGSRQAAVHDSDAMVIERSCELLEGVAILREDDRRLLTPPKKATKCARLAFVPGRRARFLEQRREYRFLFFSIAQSWNGQHTGRLF